VGERSATHHEQPRRQIPVMRQGSFFLRRADARDRVRMRHEGRSRMPSGTASYLFRFATCHTLGTVRILSAAGEFCTASGRCGQVKIQLNFPFVRKEFFSNGNSHGSPRAPRNAARYVSSLLQKIVHCAALIQKPFVEMLGLRLCFPCGLYKRPHWRRPSHIGRDCPPPGRTAPKEQPPRKLSGKRTDITFEL
jgi:hypothetical protein